MADLPVEPETGEEEGTTLRSEELAGALANFHEQRLSKLSKTQEDILRQLREMNYYLWCIAEGKKPSVQKAKKAVQDSG